MSFTNAKHDFDAAQRLVWSHYDATPMDIIPEIESGGFVKQVRENIHLWQDVIAPALTSTQHDRLLDTLFEQPAFYSFRNRDVKALSRQRVEMQKKNLLERIAWIFLKIVSFGQYAKLHPQRVDEALALFLHAKRFNHIHPNFFIKP